MSLMPRMGQGHHKERFENMKCKNCGKEVEFKSGQLTVEMDGNFYCDAGCAVVHTMQEAEV